MAENNNPDHLELGQDVNYDGDAAYLAYSPVAALYSVPSR